MNNQEIASELVKIAKEIAAGGPQDVKINSKLKGISLTSSWGESGKPYVLEIEWGKDGRSMINALVKVQHFIKTRSDGTTITVNKL